MIRPLHPTCRLALAALAVIGIRHRDPVTTAIVAELSRALVHPASDGELFAAVGSSAEYVSGRLRQERQS